MMPAKTLLLSSICALSAAFFSPSAQASALPFTPETLPEIADNIGAATLKVSMTTEDISWPITQTELAVLMGKLQNLNPRTHHNDALFEALPAKNKNYKGLTLTLSTRDGQTMPPLHIFEGNIKVENDLFQRDAGRELEYWLFGTAKVVKQQILATQVLPIFTFNHCRTLGNVIVETQPRQCLLPDNNLIFDVTERPTLKSLKITDFDTCLKSGEALIHTFPRRCMAQGGRVFTEPPRLLQRPQFSFTSPVGKASKPISKTENK